MTARYRLVGRDPVLTAARTALDKGLAGTAQVVLVSGEPGIGKTVVLDHVAREAVDRGARVLRATCWDGGAPAYWPWIQALQDAVDFESPSRRRTARKPLQTPVSACLTPRPRPSRG